MLRVVAFTKVDVIISAGIMRAAVVIPLDSMVVMVRLLHVFVFMCYMCVVPFVYVIDNTLLVSTSAMLLS